MKLTLFITLAAFAVSSMCARAAETSINELLRDALYSEEVTRDAETAAKQYAEVISRFDAQRDFAATAVFRLAEVRRKQGRKDDAIALYQRVLTEFPNSGPQVKLATENLATLGGQPPAAAQADPVDDDGKELASIQALEKTSPDLINGVEILNKAVSKNQLRVARYLLDKGTDPNAVAADAKSTEPPLCIAAGAGNLAMCEILINAGANIAGTATANPLWSAAVNDRLMVVDLLLKNGADVNYVEPRGDTALALSILFRYQAMAEKLLAAGADVNLTDPDSGLTPLHFSIVTRNTGMVRKLIEAGANPEAASLTIQTREAQRPESRENPTIRVGDTPLLLAVDMDLPEALELMLPKAKSANRGALLFRAVRNNSESMTRWLVNANADPNAQTPDGISILTRAVIHGNLELVTLLISAGAEVNAVRIAIDFSPGDLEKFNAHEKLSKSYTTAKFSPLRAAVELKERALKITTLLIEAGAKPDDDWMKALLQDPVPGLATPDIQKISIAVRNLLTERFIIPKLSGRPAVTLLMGPPGADPFAALTDEKSGTLPPGLAELLLNKSGLQWPQITYPASKTPFFPEKIEVWRTRADVAKIAWSGNLKQKEDFPPLFWGDVVRLQFNTRDPETLTAGNAVFSYSAALPDNIFWNLRRRISFPIKIDTGNGPKDFEMRGALVAFDPTKPEVPLVGAGRLARLFLLPGNYIQTLVITRKGWPNISLKSSDVATNEFSLQPGDVVKLLPDPSFQAEEIRRNGVTVLAKGLPANRYFKNYNPKSHSEATMPTLIQILADLTSYTPLAEPASQKPEDIVTQLFKNPSAILTLWMDPDLSNLRIRRLKEDNTEEILAINLTDAISKFSTSSTFEDVRASDIPLQPGDILEVTLRGDPDGRWNGFSAQQEAFFAKALNGRVQVKDRKGAIGLREINYHALQFIQTDAGKLPMTKQRESKGTATMTPLAALGVDTDVVVERDGETFSDRGGVLFLKHGDKVEVTQMLHSK